MSDKTLRLLVVEDNPGDIGLIRRTLEAYLNEAVWIDCVPSVKACRAKLLRTTYDLVLLDYSLPGESGLDFLRSVVRLDEMPPVIMLTGLGDEEVAKEAIRAGAYDYIPKAHIEPDAKPGVLGEAIRQTLQQAQRNGDERQHRAQQEQLAFHDPLTGLYNRRYLDEALQRECSRVRRYWGLVSCLMIDLDGFKECNDTYGHLEGDELLKQVAAAIGRTVRETDITARYGGDEFCIVSPETSLDDAKRLAERLRTAISRVSIAMGEHVAAVTASIGVFSPEHRIHMTPAAMIHYADDAVRQAKASGKNQVRCYGTASEIAIAS